MRELLVRLIDLLTTSQDRSSSPMASLERSITAAGHAHMAARRALAIAVAEETRETTRRAALAAKAADLETRAVEALRAGREELAIEASEAIAAIATEIEASERASKRFAAEAALARREVDAQRRRLADLDRGRRLARVGSALTDTMRSSHNGLDTISEAEAALSRVVADNEDARALRAEMAPTAEGLVERLSDAGFGEPVRVKASDVLSRLRAAAGNRPISILIESSSHSQ
jgi:phage shock protein A